MKRFMIFILMFFLLSVVFAAEGNIVEDFPTQVGFTYRSGINMGFSRQEPGIAWYEDTLGESGNEIKFSYNSAAGRIETGFFYFYAQIYTTNKVKVTFGVPNSGRDNPAILLGKNSGETLEFKSNEPLFTPTTTWGGNTYYAGEVLYDETDMTDSKLTLPRVYSLMLNLSVNPDDLVGKSSTKFTGTLVFNVEVI